MRKASVSRSRSPPTRRRRDVRRTAAASSSSSSVRRRRTRGRRLRRRRHRRRHRRRPVRRHRRRRCRRPEVEVGRRDGGQSVALPCQTPVANRRAVDVPEMRSAIRGRARSTTQSPTVRRCRSSLFAADCQSRSQMPRLILTVDVDVPNAATCRNDLAAAKMCSWFFRGCVL